MYEYSYEYRHSSYSYEYHQAAAADRLETTPAYHLSLALALDMLVLSSAETAHHGARAITGIPDTAWRPPSSSDQTLDMSDMTIPYGTVQ